MKTTNKRAWLTSFLMIAYLSPSLGQSNEIEQLLLNAEKLTQLKNILTDMKKGYQVVSKGYNAVKDISEGNFNLHEVFLDGMMKASPAVKKYRRVADIIVLQKQLLTEYKSAYNRFRESGSFGPTELDYLGKVYSRLTKESLQNLDELTTVVSSSDLRMSDDERLQSIDRIFDSMQDKLSFLRDFNKRNIILAIQRDKERRSIERVESLY
ncbi:TerB family tellurite resistance protein [Daejeonella sp. JGW-45]|uniref:TerB family tellurite resistance protein n=1 Tax=Daejeonella sp. JGW-45 TaxID=3034148 RepID=UPI0023EB8ECF|nr:TerB family tellurite resistance protein [Daejeonella sp. JGW-45]